MTQNVAEIYKQHNEKILIAKRIYNDHPYIDVRIFYLDDNDEWRPTKRGITFQPDLLSKVIEGLKKLKIKKHK